MPRLCPVERLQIGGLDVTIRGDRASDLAPIRRLLSRVERVARGTPAAAPRVTYDLFTTTKRRRLVKNGRSLFSTRHTFLLFAGFELELYSHLVDNTAATPLHAACVLIDQRAVLLAGSSGAGKTSLALELVGRGAAYLGDEHTFVWPGGAVSGFPRAPHTDSLPSTGREGFRLLDPARNLFVPERIAHRAERVAMIAILERPRRETHPVALSPGAAAAHLVSHSHRDLCEADIPPLTALCAAAPAYRLAIDGADRAADAVLEVLARAKLEADAHHKLA